MKMTFEDDNSRSFIEKLGPKPLVISKMNLKRNKQMRNQAWPLFAKCSNSMLNEPEHALPLKLTKLQNKFRNISHEKLRKGLVSRNLSKEGLKIKLKKENSDPLQLEDNKIEIKPNVIKTTNNGPSIFNVTFGCLKYASPSNYIKKKVRDKKKPVQVNQTATIIENDDDVSK